MRVIKVIREIFSPISTIGRMFIDGRYFCYTLEDPDRQRQPAGTIIPWTPELKIPGETAIPYGTYQVITNYSPKFKRVMPLLLNVPNFSGVRIHILNIAPETEGCIGVGFMKDRDRIYQSTLAFNKFYPQLRAALETNQPRLTITNTELEAKQHA